MNAIVALTEIDVICNIWTFIVSTRVELLLFVSAVLAYFALFSNNLPRSTKQERRRKGRVLDCDGPFWNPNSESDDREHVSKALQTAFANGDHRAVWRCWNYMKKFHQAPCVVLPHVVESMRRLRKDTPSIVRELKMFFKKHANQRGISHMNDLLESLGKHLDSETMEEIIQVLPEIDLKANQRTYEILLCTYFMMRNFDEVKTITLEMRENKVPFTTRATQVVLKTALKIGNFEDALMYFNELKRVWAGPHAGITSSPAPRHIVSQLVELACKDNKLSTLLTCLEGVPITEDALNLLLQECFKQKDTNSALQVEKLAREQLELLSDNLYSLFIKCFFNQPLKVNSIVEEVLARGTEVSTELAIAILSYCHQSANFSIADRLHDLVKSKNPQVLSTFIRFYGENKQYEKACDVYEHGRRLCEGSDASDRPRSLLLDPRMERSLMNAALRCGRSHLAKHLLDVSPSDVAKHITMIRSCAAENNLEGAMCVFETLQNTGVEINSIIYNTVLDACVECRNLKAAESWMEQTKQAGMADVVSFNTLIKAHLMDQNFDTARTLMNEMQEFGLEPNRVTYNELINAIVTRGGESRCTEKWDIIDEMIESRIRPNQVTCSILLKNLNGHSSTTDITRTMELINTMEDAMDEVLLSSVVEACVRIGQPELLASKLQQLQGVDGVCVSGSHTFGSLIKAYGRAKDIDGVWHCWKVMRSRHVRPTSITLGCMVEAVVSNGDTEGAFELIHQMQDDEQCRDALNSVIYCSVLKGFTREKNIERVWAVYEEMTRRRVELSIVTYNTLVDACARCGRMEYVPKILETMATQKIRPNVITYSTMLKGHCQMGDIQKGFQILDQMRSDTRLKPDEIMYNSLLDGCAQNNLVDEGIRLLAQMQKEDVTPSNFTLSILVKMMNRARKLDTAFELVDKISGSYNFKPNVHVYTNLIQACVANRQLQRGMKTFETMVNGRVEPESRTYSILVRANISQGLFVPAIGLLRAALGLPDPISLSCGDDRRCILICQKLDYAVVNDALLSLVNGAKQDLAIALISDIKKFAPRVRIDAHVQRKILVSKMARTHPHANSEMNRVGGKVGHNGRTY